MRRRRLPVLLLCCAPLAAQDAAAPEPGKYNVEKIETGLEYAEGPAWSPDGFLIFSDVPADRLVKLAPGERSAPWVERAGGPGGNAFDSLGRLYTCQTRARRVVRYDKRGKAEVLAERFEGKRLNAPNDIAVRKDGHVFFTDPAFGYQEDARELDFYGVFHLTPGRDLKLVAKSPGRPNGIALSPNGRTLYVSDADYRVVRAYDLDGKGDPAGRVVIRDLEEVPGGLKVDDKGNLYVAGRGVGIYTPDGRLTGILSTEEKASNCAFGDGDGKGLFITAGSTVYRVRLDGKVKNHEPARR